MDPKQEKWIDKLTHAANKRKEEKVKWDARDRALTQIRSKIAGKIGDNLIKDMNVTVSDGEKNKETTLDYESLIGPSSLMAITVCRTKTKRNMLGPEFSSRH